MNIRKKNKDILKPLLIMIGDIDEGKRINKQTVELIRDELSKNENIKTDFYYIDRKTPFTNCTQDIEKYISFVMQKGYNSIILGGHGYGCNEVAFYLSHNFENKHHTEIKGYMMINPTHVEDQIDFESSQVAPLISMPFTTIQGTEELSENSQKYILDLHRHSLLKDKYARYIVDGGNHNFEGNEDVFAHCVSDSVSSILAKRLSCENIKYYVSGMEK